MGFGIEMTFLLMLGFLVLGPNQLRALLRHVARAKAQFDEASRGLKSQFASELDPAHLEVDTDTSPEFVADQ